jgi:hypothetical protein
MLDFREHFLHITKDVKKLAKALAKRMLSPPLKSLAIEQLLKYAMLATIDTPIKIRIPTTITIAGSQHQQIIHIQLNPHNKSILSKAYLGLFQNPHTQSLQPTITMPTVH